MLGTAAVLLRGAGDHLFFWPDGREHGTPASWGLDAEPVSFAAPAGPKLQGWWCKAEGEARGTVVYCHGNHANLTHHA